MQDVKCTVSNCKYYKSQKCTANTIEINVDDGGQKATNAQYTQCHTFETK